MNTNTRTNTNTSTRAPGRRMLGALVAALALTGAHAGVAHAQISGASPTPDDRILIEHARHGVVPIYTRPGTQVLTHELPDGMWLQAPRGRTDGAHELWTLHWDVPALPAGRERADFTVRLGARRAAPAEPLATEFVYNLTVVADLRMHGLTDALAPATQHHELTDHVLGFVHPDSRPDLLVVSPDAHTTVMMPLAAYEPACASVGVAPVPGRDHALALTGAPGAPGTCSVTTWSRFGGAAISRTSTLEVSPNHAPAFTSPTPSRGQVLEVARGRDLTITLATAPDAGPEPLTLTQLTPHDGDSLVPLGPSLGGGALYRLTLTAPSADAELAPGQSARFIELVASDGALSTTRDFVVDFILPPDSPDAAPPVFVGRSPGQGERVVGTLDHAPGETSALITLDVFDHDTPLGELTLTAHGPPGATLEATSPGTFIVHGARADLIENSYLVGLTLSDGAHDTELSVLLDLTRPVAGGPGEVDQDVDPDASGLGDGGGGELDVPLATSSVPEEGCCSQVTPSRPAPSFTLSLLALALVTLRVRTRSARAPERRAGGPGA